MGTGKNKAGIYFLFMFTATAGIAVFVSAWNSWLQGKEKMLVSLFFLALLLGGLFFLFYRLNKLLTEKNYNNTPYPQSDNESAPLGESQKTEESFHRYSSADLLNGAFSKTDIKSTAERILKNLAHEFEIVQGTFFILNPDDGIFKYTANYACTFETTPPDLVTGEGINGQAAADQRIITIPNLPESYKPVFSGLGKGKARYLYIIPLVYENITLAVIEISCFKEIDENGTHLLHKLMREGGEKFNSVIYQVKK